MLKQGVDRPADIIRLEEKDLSKRTCDLCEREYVCGSPAELKVHRNRHLNIKPYPCQHEGCGSSFASKTELKQHAAIHQVNRGYYTKIWMYHRYLCVMFNVPTSHGTALICGRVFNNAELLAAHVASHKKTKPLPFPCTHKGCMRAFKFKSR